MTRSLAPWSLFAALIAAAGLPIYLHALTVSAETFGIGLVALGLTLMCALGRTALSPPRRLALLCRNAIVPPAPPPAFAGDRP